MKKLSFFLMAMLISLVSFAEEATLSFADKAQRTSFSSTQQVWEQDGITFTNDKASSSSDVADYANPVRLYQGSAITVECGKGNITQIVFATNASKYVTPMQNSLGSSLGTVAVSGNNVTLTLSTPAASINAIALTAQVRLNSITVTYEKVQSTEPTITCANVSFGIVKAGATSTKELVVEAENLTEAITATFETGTAFSVTGDLTTTGGTLTLAVIATEEGTYNDVLTLTSGTATKTVEVSANVITCQGEGTEEKPYLIADVIKLANSGEVAWVEGYIIGVMNNNELVTSNIETNSNIVIASTVEDTVTYVPVAIPTEIRAEINLVDNPTNLGKKIAVKGKLDAYFSMPGMRETSEYKWAVTKYTVTATAENGTVAGAGEYEENAEATLTATANEGYEFTCWTSGEDTVSTANPYTFVVTANVALVANFKAVVVEEPLPEGVPTNAELWEAFKPYYNTYYGLTRADQPIDKVSTFAAAKMQEIMTDAASEYKWLGDYVLGVAAGQGVNLPTDMAAANEGAWRWAVHAFFNATTGANGAAGTDFTEAGKPQVWGPYYLAAQKPAEGPVEIVGVVKRALQLGETTIILTHEANGTPHIYTVAGDAIAEVSQEGVVAKDTANAGDYLTISDIALTEDGKLVACNYVRNQFEDKDVDAGYKRGTLHLYVWHDIKGAASIWFESMFTGNSLRGDCGYTMAVNGTVANANILVTAVHNSHRGVRMSHYTVIDSAYVEPNYANQTFNNHLFYVGAKFKGASAGVDAATFNEATHGVNFQLNASPLAENNWVMDSEGLMPTEFGVAAQQDPSIVGAVAETLVSKALVGAYYVTVGDKKVMVAPYADAEGKLAGVKLLDITAGFANAALLTTAESLDLTAPVAATGVATTAVVESNGTLTINLIADATIHTMTATIQESPSTNLENNNVQNDIIKFYQNGQIYIMINGAVYNVMGQMVK